MNSSKITRLVQTKTFKYTFLVFTLALAFFPILLSFKYEPIFCDSSYYLSVVNRIAEGYIPYKTLSLGYTPIWFYMMALLKKIFFVSDVCYEFYLFIHYCFVIGCALCTYKIALSLNISKTFSYLTAWLFLILSHWMQGNAVLLEIPSLFWGLLSIDLILNKSRKSFSFKSGLLSYLGIGILCSFSFLTKQYGLGFFALCLYLLLINRNSFIHKIVFFLIGFIIPVSICFMYFGTDFFKVFTNGYGTSLSVLANIDTSFGARLSFMLSKIWIYFWRICPCLFLLPFAFFLAYKNQSIEKLLFLIFGFLGFSLQFYFLSDALHYSLYLLPFALLLTSYQTFLFKNKYLKVTNYFLYLITILFALFSTYYNRVLGHYYYYPQGKMVHEETAAKVLSLVNPEDKIWTYDATLIYMYYYTNLLPPNLAQFGYSFGPLVTTPERVLLQMQSSDYVLTLIEDHENTFFLTEEVVSYLESHERILISDNVYMYNMNKLVDSQ